MFCMERAVRMVCPAQELRHIFGVDVVTRL